MKARIRPLKDRIQDQVDIFYEKYDFIKTDKIEFKIVDDIYEARLQLLENSPKEVQVTKQNENKLRNFNGHVAWGYKPNDTITVLFNKNKMDEDPFTWRGTVHHEYIHAHDFLELLPSLGFENNDQIYDNYIYYDDYNFWTEFRARAFGGLNVFSHEYKSKTSKELLNICNVTFKQNCEILVEETSKYNRYGIAQCLGRQLALEKFFGTITPALKTACDEFGVLEEVVNLYDYLVLYPSFNEVDFAYLKNLLYCIESKINQR